MRLLTSLLAASLALPALAQDGDDAANASAMTRPDSEESEANEGVDAEGESGEVAAPAVTTALSAAEEQDRAAADAARDARISGLEHMLMRQREEITRMRLKMLDTPNLTFDLEGEYRARGYVFPNLFAEQERDARYMDHWLRLRPVFRYKDLASMHVEFRGLQNVVWGDNISLSDTALFANNPSNTNIDGQEMPSIEMNRAWIEFNVPVGIVRVGRMPSEWGLGLLVQNGDGFPNTFGEVRNSTTFDRALFATKPIAIAQTIMGKEVADIPLFFAVSVDRLVEAPLNRYYGYECIPNIPESSEAYDPRCDTNGDGLTEQNHGFADDTVTTASRNNPGAGGRDWWANQDDDVWELVLALIYRGEDVRYLGGRGDLSVGGYAIHRLQQETSSDVWIWDAYIEAEVHNAYVGFEGVWITGESRALLLSDGSDDPLYKNVNIGGYVGRLGYDFGDFDVRFEHGFAGGDNSPSDGQFTGRPLNPDYNVGFILYEEVMSRVTRRRWTDAANGLWSGGGVYNSRYINPTAHYSPLENWDLHAGLLLAWPHRPDGNIILCKPGDNVECSSYGATASMLGWEFDFAVKHRWHEHLLLSLETGYAKVTDRVPLEAVGLNPNGNFFTFQSRIAWEF